jgi:predicted adenylyl cyclase CyaB
VLALGARSEGLRIQTDRYFQVSSEGGERLKLRTVPGREPELVRYRRPESEAVRSSDYELTLLTSDAEVEQALGGREPIVTVRKRREVLLLENVRIHLDQVEHLGSFVEFEALVDEEHDDGTCHGQVRQLMAALGLHETDLLQASYSDMLLAGAPAASPRVL